MEAGYPTGIIPQRSDRCQDPEGEAGFAPAPSSCSRMFRSVNFSPNVAVDVARHSCQRRVNALQHCRGTQASRTLHGRLARPACAPARIPRFQFFMYSFFFALQGSHLHPRFPDVPPPCPMPTCFLVRMLWHDLQRKAHFISSGRIFSQLWKRIVDMALSLESRSM